MRVLAILAIATMTCQVGLANENGQPVVDFTSETSDLSFTAETIDGETLRLEPGFDAELTVVCFLGVECPLAKLYVPRLNQMVDDYEGRVRFIGVDSNSQDSINDLQDFENEQDCKFVLIKDEQNRIADRFQAERTPEVFVIDRQLQVKYRGRIDDQYFPGITRSAPRRRDLLEAINQLLNGTTVSVPETTAVGCIIGRVKESVAAGSVTYCNQISKILQKHCRECHRDGEIGPFSMTDFNEVVGWADTILEVVEAGRMPPWHANPDHGHFSNERQMQPFEKQLLREWVEAGAPYGDMADLLQSGSFDRDDESWKPDLVIAMRDHPFQVPAEGVVDYQYFVVDPGFTEDKWVKMARVVPGNPAVVHHSVVFVRTPDGTRFRGFGWLADYIPGQRMEPGSDTRAKFVPAGSKLVFQQHYSPNGRVQSDKTKIEICFADPSQVTHEIFSIVDIDQDFEIPPGAADYVVKKTVGRLPRQGELLAIIPHMHFRGKSFRVVVEQAGKSSILLDVPHYDFNWQHSYQLAKPIALSKIDRLDFEATFDNSDANPSNPNSSEFVYWGEQTWQEMAMVLLEVAVPLNNNEELLADRRRTEVNSRDGRETQLAEEFMSRFDKNNDKVVARSEVTTALRRSEFRQIDTNRDDKLQVDELKAAFRKRIRH